MGERLGGSAARRLAPGTRYGFGLLCVAVAAVLVGVILPESAQDGWWPALVIALVVQAPLGWWVVRSVGKPSFLWAWGAGLLARFGLVGLAAFLLVPRLGWPPAATLLSLVTLLLAMLALETVVVVLEQSHAER
ncbi:MAG: hypothetical protein M3Y31_04155 [Gemmatimonadota bacterium]|nr:hypothetical protein [Gemmatimonadota bacterium]